jgi:hypothetical protein
MTSPSTRLSYWASIGLRASRRACTIRWARTRRTGHILWIFFKITLNMLDMLEYTQYFLVERARRSTRRGGRAGGWAHRQPWPSMWLLRPKCEAFDFFKKFYKVQLLKFGVKIPININNFSSLMFTNLDLRFEPCILNLIWQWGAKDPKKREDHLIFINFGVKKFTLKNTPKKKLWCLNVIISYIPWNEEL